MSRKHEFRSLGEERDAKVAKDTEKFKQRSRDDLQIGLGFFLPLALVAVILFRNLSPESKVSVVENITFGLLAVGMVLAKAAKRR
jgi:hypothetical protein